MIRQGSSRRQIARSLNAAYADGLLSQDTFVARIEQLLGPRLIDPWSLIGDLTFRGRRGWQGGIRELRRALGDRRAARQQERELLLALDWTGSGDALMVGRHHTCDIVLPESSVSRRHARLVFRDGAWVIQDLESTNGTIVNGVRVGRCALRPGDRLWLGDALLRVD